MSSYPFLDGIRHLPAPADAERVTVGQARLMETLVSATPELQSFGHELIGEPAGRALLAAVFGNSPFLTECLLRDLATLRELAITGPDVSFAQILEGINGEMPATASTTEVMTRLRQAKRRSALVIALADLAGIWPLEKVTAALSALADQTLDHALCHALGSLLPPATPLARDALVSGLVVLGMGKLGAGELNYSSDVDLILLLDRERVPEAIQEVARRTSLQQVYVRAAQAMLRLMSERTADGYVFRTDLRIRPDPASTPLVISTDAAEAYYESVGQNWERAAMIRARPVAGDYAAASNFLRHLRPFLWRKHLDFAAIADIHSIKRQINARAQAPDPHLLGTNIKLGRGGIREIEFFAQVQQLIWGGRVPSLRVSGTCAALQALADEGRIAPETADELSAAYRYLRQIEHRLQMVDDQQTHSLPTTETAFEAIARFAGYDDASGLRLELNRQLETVAGHYAQLFVEAPTLARPQTADRGALDSGDLVFTGAEADPSTVATLQGMGYADGDAVSALVRGWHHGRMRSMRTARARELLTELTPTLLAAFAACDQPDESLRRFDRFLEGLPAGVSLFSLFQAHPELLALVATIMGSAPRLAEQLGRHPNLLEALLDLPPPDAVEDDLPSAAKLEASLATDLSQADDFQDQLDLTRRWTGEQRFRLGVRVLLGQVGTESAARHLTDLSETAIRGLLPCVEASFALNHGRVPGGAFSVLGLGKLGGRELSFTSDLDLVFVYRLPAGDEASDGPKPLPSSLYFARLGQRLITALTAPTSEGLLFEVDMRLRPTGNKGPVAVEIGGFERYYREDAWIWEHMALSRARVVAATDGFASEVEAVMRGIIATPRDADALVIAVADMRGRILRDRTATVGPPGRWNPRYRRGALLDVEFAGQHALLAAAADDPGLITGNTIDLLERLIAGGRLPGDAGQDLLASARLWQAVQFFQRLVQNEPFDPARAGLSMRAAFAQAAGAIDFPSLERDIDAVSARALAAFDRLVEGPARAAAARSKPQDPKPVETAP